MVKEYTYIVRYWAVAKVETEDGNKDKQVQSSYMRIAQGQPVSMMVIKKELEDLCEKYTPRLTQMTIHDVEMLMQELPDK